MQMPKLKVLLVSGITLGSSITNRYYESLKDFGKEPETIPKLSLATPTSIKIVTN